MTVVLVLLFWIAAAAAVAAAQIALPPFPAAAATIAAIVFAAFAYTRVCAREAGITHALGVGVTWLVLAIATEIIVTTRIGHGWSALLGSPDHPLLRNVFLFVWIFAPAVFARRQDENNA